MNFGSNYPYMNFPSYSIHGYYYDWGITPEELVNLTEDVELKAKLVESSKQVKYYIDEQLVK